MLPQIPQGFLPLSYKVKESSLEEDLLGPTSSTQVFSTLAIVPLMIALSETPVALSEVDVLKPEMGFRM